MMIPIIPATIPPMISARIYPGIPSTIPLFANRAAAYAPTDMNPA